MGYLKCMHISLCKKQLDFHFHFNLHFISRISDSSQQTGIVHEEKLSLESDLVYYNFIYSEIHIFIFSSLYFYYFVFLP